MNTPAHVVLGGVVLGHGAWRRHWLAISGGALAPDAPMLLFYLVERLGRGAPERLIWSELYFDPGWQGFFDVFNSVPLFALLALVAWRLGSSAALAFFAAAALHCLTDLPLHREDAHAHFLPFSDWRFVSPVSYWDPRHGGRLFVALELLGTLTGALVLARRDEPRGWRAVGLVTLACYLGFIAFAVVVWL